MRAWLLLPLVLGLLLVACGCDDGEGDGGSDDPSSLEGTAWVLEEGIDVSGWEESRPTLELDSDGRISGNGGCNRFGAGYELDGSRIEIGAVMATKIGCPGSPGEVETAFFAALDGVEEWGLDDGRLVLSGQGEELRFSAATPEGDWAVTSLLHGGAVKSLLPGTGISAGFAADGSLSGSSGCNFYQGSYETEGDRIEVRELSVTERACTKPRGVMEQEDAYLQALSRAARFLPSGQGGLQLLNERGNVLVAFEAS